MIGMCGCKQILDNGIITDESQMLLRTEKAHNIYLSLKNDDRSDAFYSDYSFPQRQILIIHSR